MLETILKMYTMYMAYDVRSPMPHFIGPPGAGKSTVAAQAAKLLGVNLHVISVARLSPLEIEGVQMPVGMDSEDPTKRKLELLLNEMWASLQEGDIVLWDEYLRGFPEVYNALLDINTSRHVRGHDLPKVFMLGASNTAVAYDPALEDRLLHIPVDDPRKKRGEKTRLMQLFVDTLGLHPEVVKSTELTDLFDTHVLPMYNVIDSFQKGAASAVGKSSDGHSMRNLIGQVQLRHIVVPELIEVLNENNRLSVRDDKMQFVILPTGKNPPPKYVTGINKLPLDKLTPLQATNLRMNRELMEMETIRSTTQQEGTTDDDSIDIF